MTLGRSGLLRFRFGWGGNTAAKTWRTFSRRILRKAIDTYYERLHIDSMRTHSFGIDIAVGFALALSSAGCVAAVGDDEAAVGDDAGQDVGVITQALEANPSIVISQIYGGGGNFGASLNRDFVELYNRGNHPVSLANWSVQYASATGNGGLGTNFMLIRLPAVTLQPGRYFLVAGYMGPNGSAIPTPDASGQVNLALGSGKVALARISTPLGCNGGSLPCSAQQLANMIDFVGYGTANFYEGAGPAPVLSNTTSAHHWFGGCATHTNDNSADFVVGAPQPRNNSVFQACNFAGTTP